MRKQLFWHGTPVPYVALWSSEEYTHIAPDKHAGGRDAIFLGGERGAGEPVWATMNDARQRETIATFRCQVCNGKLKGGRIFGMDVPQRMLHGGAEHPLLREPPTCLQCARLTMRLCPGTRRRQESGVLECFEVFEYTPICTILQHIPPEQGGTPALCRVLRPGQTCIGMNKCMLTRYKCLSFDQLKAALA